MPSCAEGTGGTPWCCGLMQTPLAVLSHRDGLPAAPGARGEGAASPQEMLSVDSEAEWETQQLLEGEGRGREILPHPC